MMKKWLPHILDIDVNYSPINTDWKSIFKFLTRVEIVNFWSSNIWQDLGSTYEPHALINVYNQELHNGV